MKRKVVQLKPDWHKEERKPLQPLPAIRRKRKIDQKHYSVQDVARTFGVSQDIIYDAIRKRQLDAQPFGRVYRISEDALQDYLEQQRKRKLG